MQRQQQQQVGPGREPARFNMQQNQPQQPHRPQQWHQPPQLLRAIQAAIKSEERQETLQRLNPTLASRIKIKAFKKQVGNRMRWYYEKKELRNTPSIQAGMDIDTESRYRREGARFVIDIGSSMNLSLTTMATGVVYFHRFYMFHTFQDFTRYPTALACLFLAGKVEETPKKCKDMLKFARDTLNDEKFSQFGPDVQKSEEVMTLERIILQTIKFDLHVEHPYTYLLKYAKCLKGDKSRLQKMVQMAWTFVNDSLCTTLCLQWEPEIVAIALMHLAGKLSKFDVVDWNGRTSDHFRWWDMFVEDMTIELLEDICHQVLDLYSQTQNMPQTDSPPPPPQGPAVPGASRAGGSQPSSSQPSPAMMNNSAPNSQGGSKNSTPVAVMPPIAAQAQVNFAVGGAGVPPPPQPQQFGGYGMAPQHMPPPHMMQGFGANPPLPSGFPPRPSGMVTPTPPLPPFPPMPQHHQQQFFAPQPPLPPSGRPQQPPPPPK